LTRDPRAPSLFVLSRAHGGSGRAARQNQRRGPAVAKKKPSTPRASRGKAPKPALERSGRSKTTSPRAPKKPAAPASRAPGAAGKPAAKPAAERKPMPASKPAKPAPAPAEPAAPAKPQRKGITIVSPKPAKPPPRRPRDVQPLGSSLPKLPVAPRTPLIPSGPMNTVPGSGLGEGGDKPLTKSPLGKRELDRFRRLLLAKRAELIGDVSSMEGEALKGQSGSLSHLPQHMAEQGSDAYDQSLSLDLAAADRRLIQEIDDALARIEAGTFGICELTGRPVRPERLEELPWARYSIDAARAMERRGV
jgi:DnaK suppressor protein